MEPFIDSVVALDKADTEARRTEFKRFVNEFGTHYASTTEMGTRELQFFGGTFYLDKFPLRIAQIS